MTLNFNLYTTFSYERDLDLVQLNHHEEYMGPDSQKS